MQHTLKKFDLERAELHAKLIRMAEIVIEQLERALGCLAEHDMAGTRVVVERDLNVNRMDIDLEEMCLQFLALHQPVAGDLRFITAIMKITTELERIGDRAVDLCDAVHDRDGGDPVESHKKIACMGALGIAMLRDSMTAFSNADAALANEVFRKDKEFDALHCEILSSLMTRMQAAEQSGHEVKLAFLSKDLNEISEHATNIAEVVMFMVDGKEIIHMDMHERRATR